MCDIRAYYVVMLNLYIYVMVKTNRKLEYMYYSAAPLFAYMVHNDESCIYDDYYVRNRRLKLSEHEFNAVNI